MGSAEVPAESQVVHLVQYWDGGAAPADLRVRPRMGRGGRVALGVVLGVVIVIGVGPIVLLWTFPTPGWWFSLLFTVMIGLLVIGSCLWYADSLRRGRHREWAAARWAEILPTVRSSPGVVRAREVATREDGAVARFSLTVDTQDGTRVTGVWRPRSSDGGSLLQSQVPGVGAPVRVWRGSRRPATDPVVIEALDPTVIPNPETPAPEKYVE